MRSAPSTTWRKAATGVRVSATSSRQTGTTRCLEASVWNPVSPGPSEPVPERSGHRPAESSPKVRKKQVRWPVWHAPAPSWSTTTSSTSPSQS